MFHFEFCVLGFRVPRLGEVQVSLWDDKGLSAADINHERPQLTGTAAEVAALTFGKSVAFLSIDTSTVHSCRAAGDAPFRPSSYPSDIVLQHCGH
jgi:hypothetical protein